MRAEADKGYIVPELLAAELADIHFVSKEILSWFFRSASMT
ncbi:hypothetical protein [Mesorhizobium sp. ORS 3428]